MSETGWPVALTGHFFELRHHDIITMSVCMPPLRILPVTHRQVAGFLG
jgi:hypothetical protein